MNAVHKEDKTTTAARSHRTALEITPADLVSALCLKLGTKVVAYIVAKDTSTVNRWKSGSITPTEEQLLPLRVAYQVFNLLEAEESDHTIRAWFLGMNPQLDDASPTERLRDGEIRDVMAAARAFAAGG